MYLGNHDINDGDPLKLGNTQIDKIMFGNTQVWINTIVPSYISDFNASDSNQGNVTYTFSNSTGIPTPTYDLYQNGVSVQTNISSGGHYNVNGGTRSYYVRAINTAGYTNSNTNNGTSYELPGYISNFSATDNRTGNVVVTFSTTTGVPTPTYDLYENSSLVATNITSGYQRNVSAGVRNYYVRAKNAVGNTMSNSDYGTSKAAAGSQTFTSNGTFQTPLGYTSVNVCMIGGGGSGGCTDDRGAGGGYAGQIKSFNQAVVPGGNYGVTVGVGGTAVYGNYLVGHSGASSVFHGTTATGGTGGSLNACGTGYIESCSIPYNGKGASRTTCGGTYNDGYYTACNGTVRGGQAGAFGNGGNSKQNGVGGSGGGAGATSGGCGASGAGGKGQVRVSWS